MKSCVKASVYGGVQGVGYRLFCKRKAREFNIEGYALNLNDGRVEVLMYGEVESISAMVEALNEGPAFSNVLGVDLEEAEIPTTSGFMTG